MHDTSPFGHTGFDLDRIVSPAFWANDILELIKQHH
jgi:hypothetical protein